MSVQIITSARLTTLGIKPVASRRASDFSDGLRGVAATRLSLYPCLNVFERIQNAPAGTPDLAANLPVSWTLVPYSKLSQLANPDSVSRRNVGLASKPFLLNHALNVSYLSCTAIR